MPEKIRFTVVYCSGWEDDYPPRDLEVQSPFIKGWRSPRYCLFPQELVIQINPPVRVQKLQLLSHQYMIASKIDIYIGHLPSDCYTSIESAQFKRLGYISLLDNEQTGHWSRELKSVNLDYFGHLIKLVLQSNHINKLNVYNQVSIVALNVIGEPSASIDPMGISLPNQIMTHPTEKDRLEAVSKVFHFSLPSTFISHGEAPDPIVLGAINKHSSSISTMDDLEFAIVQDPQTADLIRKLDKRKLMAVTEEQFEYAKQLMQVIDELQKIGKVLCRYEVDKKLAVEREDYDTAREKKIQLDSIRSQVYERLGIQGLLDSNVESVKNKFTVSSHGSHDHSHGRVKYSMPLSDMLSPSASTTCSDIDGSVPLPQISSDVGHTPSSPPRAPMFSDDRPLPALVSKKVKQDMFEKQPKGSKPTEDESEVLPEQLTKKQYNAVQTAVEVFGIDLMKHIYAKKYYLREKCLHGVTKHLRSLREVNRKETGTIIKATCQVLEKALNDQVVSSFVLSIDLLNNLVGQFCQKHRANQSDFSSIMAKVVPVLLLRTGDMTSRIHTAAMDTIMELSLHPQIKSFSIIGPLLLQSFNSQKKPPWKLTESLVKLLGRIVLDVGLESCGFTLKNLMEFLCPLLSHPRAHVRDTSVKLVYDLYQMKGTEVRQMLPVPDDSTSRKKILWKSVFEGFDRIDQMPMLAKKEAAVETGQKAKSDMLSKEKVKPALHQAVANKGPAEPLSPVPDPVVANNGPEERLAPVPDPVVANNGPEERLAPVPDPVAANNGPDEWLLPLPDPAVANNGPEEWLSPVPDPVAANNGPEERLAPVPDPVAAHDNSLDMTCVFCGEQRQEFAENGMESHYLDHCPMLQSCPHCTQVIEIWCLTKHWLVECEAREKFTVCPNCSEAILRPQFDSHTSRCKQTKSKESHSMCPLCHVQIQDGEENWKSHLMGSGAKACRKNPRKKGLSRAGSNRTGAVAAGTKRTMIPRAVLGKKCIDKKKTK